MRADDSPQAMSKLENGTIGLNDLFEKSKTTKAALAGKQDAQSNISKGFLVTKKKKNKKTKPLTFSGKA